MTLQLLLGCNLVSLLGTRLVTLLWRVVEQQAIIMAVVAVRVDCSHQQFHFLLEPLTQ
jgi:hypothetical protein